MTSTPVRTDPQQSLKKWLDFQFMEVHKKLNALTESTERLQHALLKKKHRKVNIVYFKLNITITYV